MKHTHRILMATILMCGFIFSACAEIVASYDAIIFGSGISGMTAALELAKNGKKVLIVEEKGITGGNKRLLSGGVSYLDIDSGDTVDSFVNDIEANNVEKNNFYVQHFVERSIDLPIWMRELEIDLTGVIKMPGNSFARTLVSENGRHSGKEVTSKLEKALKSNKVSIDYNTTINKIELISNSKYLVSLEKNATIVNVKATSIVFAEDANNVFDVAVPIRTEEDITEKFSSDVSVEMTTGMNLLQKMNVDIATSGELNIIDTYNSDLGMLISPGLRAYGAFLVNAEGKRFVNEMETNQNIVKAIIKQTDQSAYIVYDSKIHDQLKYLDEYYNVNAVVKSDTISDFSEKTGLPENALYETLVQYTLATRNKDDTSFSRSFPDDFEAFTDTERTDQLYGVKVKPYLNIHPAYANITDKFEVIKNQDIVPGIYAIGDSAKGVLPDSLLHGAELSYAIIMGQDVAENIEMYIADIDASKN